MTRERIANAGLLLLLAVTLVGFMIATIRGFSPDNQTPTAAATPTPTATALSSPTPEAWQWCRVTAPLRVRNGYSLQADVLRVLAVDDVVAIDANVRPVVTDGFRWFPLVAGGWVAEGWMVCG